MIAAYFYSMGRSSLYSEKLLFDNDSKSGSMRLSKSLTYEEALRAALRFYDSGIKQSDHIPTQEDTRIIDNAKELRDRILQSKTTVTVTGTSYYVSNSGNDNYDGLAPETAWATAQKVNSVDLKKATVYSLNEADCIVEY